MQEKKGADFWPKDKKKEAPGYHKVGRGLWRETDLESNPLGLYMNS